MFCKNCGTKFEENSNVCANCGYVEESIEINVNDEFFEDKDGKVEENLVDNENDKKCDNQPVNINAIVGFCLAFSFPILGLIFSALGMKWAKLNDNAGKKFAVAGLVLSIVFISLSIIEFMVNCSISFISTLYNSSLL